MRRFTCPYLGLKDDPTTTLNFPSPGNFCHQARPVAPVKGDYQENYCLTANHTACPLYQASHPVPLPAAIAARTGPSFTSRQVLALIGVPIMVITVAFFTYLWSNLGWGIWQASPIPDTGPGIVENRFGLLGAGSTSNRTSLSPSASNITPLSTNQNCPLPTNWVTYIVKPTDSLFRLSVIYGVSVEDLQRANCLGNQTVILPGQVIYVPFIPTNTPMEPLAPQPQLLPTQTSGVNQQPRTATNTSQPPEQPTAAVTAAPSSTPDTPTQQPTSSPEPTDAFPTLPPPPLPTIIIPTIGPPPIPTIAPPPLPTDEPPPLPTDEPPPLPTDEPPPLPTDEPPPLPTDEPPPLPTDEPPPIITIDTPPPTSEPPPLLTTEAPLPTDEPPPLPTDEPLPLETTELPPVFTTEAPLLPTIEPFTTVTIF